MKYRIEEIERTLKDRESWKALLKSGKWSPAILRAYRDTERTQEAPELIDFKEIPADLTRIARELKGAGVKEFTISSTFSGLIERLWELYNAGYETAGVTQMKRFCGYEGDYETVHAILMRER